MANLFNRGMLLKSTKNQGDFTRGDTFNVEIDSVTIGGINKIDGVEYEVEVIEYQDGEDQTPHYRPGRLKPGRIVMERDWASNPEFYKWYETLVKGEVERKSVSIVFTSDDRQESKRLNLYDAYPTKWAGPTSNARQSGHAAEKIECHFERMDLK